MAETGARHAKEQAAAAARFSSDQASKAVSAARIRGNLLSASAQQKATRAMGDVRDLGSEMVAAAATKPALQKVSRKARQVAVLRDQQMTRLHRRWASLIIVVAATVGIAVGFMKSVGGRPQQPSQNRTRP